MGLNFYYYDGLQPKMSAGMINEHECMYLPRLFNVVKERTYTYKPLLITNRKKEQNFYDILKVMKCQSMYFSIISLLLHKHIMYMSI